MQLKVIATIKGIKVDKKEIKVSLNADITTVFVRDLDSISHLLALQKTSQAWKLTLQKQKSLVVGKTTPKLNINL